MVNARPTPELRAFVAKNRSLIATEYQASSGTEFGVRVAYDELDALAGPRRALLGSLYTSWSVFSGAALTASYANWSMRDGGEPDDSRTTFRMSLRAPL